MISKELILFIIIAIISFFAASYILNANNQFEFSFYENDTRFVSNSVSPETELASISKNKDFYIFAPMTQNPSPNNTSMTNDFVIPLTVVLEGSDKDTIIFFQVFDESNNLIRCNTNFGDVKTQQGISKEDCLKFINSEDFAIVKIFTEFPNQENQNIILIDERTILAKPKAYNNLKPLALGLSKTLFSNAEDVIKNSNIFSGFITR